MTGELSPESQLCKCGCGEYANPGYRFILGHANRGDTYWKTQQEPQLCKCGCGEYAKPGNRFIFGHQRKGKKHSQKTIAKISKTKKGIPKQPFSLDHCAAISKAKTGENNPMYGICGGNDIVNHHYIYDHSDLSKYTMKVTRSKHVQIHAWMRKAGINVPHINVKGENNDI